MDIIFNSPFFPEIVILFSVASAALITWWIMLTVERDWNVFIALAPIIVALWALIRFVAF